MACLLIAVCVRGSPLVEASVLRHAEGVQEAITMSRVINLPVRVETAADGTPSAFTWRGVRYRVLHANEVWQLADCWWVMAAEADRNGGKGYGDRWHYRVHARASASPRPYRCSSLSVLCYTFADTPLCTSVCRHHASESHKQVSHMIERMSIFAGRILMIT
jgi:hypothetical protein